MLQSIVHNRVVGKVHNRKVVTEPGGWCFTRLSEFSEKVRDPLYLSESCSKSPILRLNGASTHVVVFHELLRDEVGAEKDAVPYHGTSIIRVARLSNLNQKTR
ncbi:hypothetical protein PIB30_086099 [Stylosanthes scabra]|uniref:Uncharacterized protein n=1 Tax=Stylosanthes scabra TaxID=79078 RepID=A0ABU6WRD4_9FABA|nr:hypothetical protein [Stylosanthes scabra]